MKKVGIVTFNDAINNGAFLQEYALQRILRSNGIEAEVIDYHNPEFVQLYKYANNPFKRVGLKNKFKIIYNIIFRPKIYYARLRKKKKFEQCWDEEIIHSKDFESHKDDIIESYDYFISGSDQVWNLRMTGYNLFYLLDFVPDNKKKLSYAASFGRTEFNNHDYEIFKKYIGMFSNVLVREQSGKKLLSELCNINSEVVLDPTLLLGKKEWLHFAQKAATFKTEGKYILIYVISLPTNLYRAAIKYADERNMDIIMLGRNSDIVVDGRRIKATVDAGPYEYVNYINNAEAIFTSSFHGTIFSINLEKPFFYELSKDKYNNNARLIDITSLLGINGREIQTDYVSDSQIDWRSIHEKLNSERNISKERLLNSLN